MSERSSDRIEEQAPLIALRRRLSRILAGIYPRAPNPANWVLDPALHRGIYDRNARAQLLCVFIYVRQADGQLCRPERHQIEYVGNGQMVARHRVHLRSA